MGNKGTVEQRLDRETRINALTRRIHDSNNFVTALEESYPELMALLDAERVTIYEKSRRADDLISRFKVKDGLQEIRVPLATTSIAGYCGLSRQALCIPDVYNQHILQAIHSSLTFDASFDDATGFRSLAILAVPILHQNQLLGVLQAVNRGKSEIRNFDDESVQLAQRIAHLLGQKFRYEFQATTGPYSYLVQRGRVSEKDLNEFTRRAKTEKTTVSALLMGEARLLPSEIGASLERYYQVPYLAFDPNVRIPRELLKGVKDAYLRQSLWVPISGDRSSVTVLIDDPSDESRMAEIRKILGAERYVFRVGLPEDVLRFLGQDVALPNRNESLAELVEAGSAGDGGSDIAQPDASEATVVQLVNRLIFEAHVARASDVHLEPNKPPQPGQVRFRIDGQCTLQQRVPAQLMRAAVARIKVMSRLDISEQRLPQDGKLLVRIRDEPVELRVATLPTVHGEGVTLRLLAGSKMMRLEDLNILADNLEGLRQIATQPHGIFLVVGPTGSGKTTTLHAFLQLLNRPEKKVWTAEDPVEITQEGLQQVQVNPKIGLTFARALRAFLRADPDVVMIGEMRDAETATIGIEASLTGHLVLSTLHTNSAAETITRLLDLGIDTANFADAFLGVLSQRLVRRLCTHCKESYRADDEAIRRLAHYSQNILAETKPATLYRARGCDACNGTGYAGRLGVHEMLVTHPELKKLIVERANAATLNACGRRHGMRSLAEDIIEKIKLGLTDVAQLQSTLGRLGHDP